MARLISILTICVLSVAADAGEADHYRLITLPIPNNIRLEVSGIAVLPNHELAVAIRKGEIWRIENAYTDPPEDLKFHLMAEGLHEPLGLAYHNDDLYTVQRSELTRLRDTNGDGVVDEYLTIAKGWGLTGNYHEYAFGPLIDRDGNFWLTLNCSIGKKLGDDDAWRGWSIRVDPGGQWSPISAGLRAPCGLGMNATGDVFCVDHQGHWVPTCSLIHIEPGDFHGHVEALKHTKRPESPVKHPGNIPAGLTIPQAAEQIPGFKLPAVWFPYNKMGQGLTDIACDRTGGRFGPFTEQLFVGDFTSSSLFRVDLESVKGQYQGACFRFRTGLQCAAMRLAWGEDGSMFIGQTNRGWNSLGTSPFGLQRLIFTGKIPFAIQTMRAMSDGFELTFTQPVDLKTLRAANGVKMQSYTHHYRPAYGSPEIDVITLDVSRIRSTDDNRTVFLAVSPLRSGYIHELTLAHVTSMSGAPLLHDTAYYTLNQIPDK